LANLLRFLVFTVILDMRMDNYFAVSYILRHNSQFQEKLNISAFAKLLAFLTLVYSLLTMAT